MSVIVKPGQCGVPGSTRGCHPHGEKNGHDNSSGTVNGLQARKQRNPVSNSVKRKRNFFQSAKH